jgi:tape measure domain-containing protein
MPNYEVYRMDIVVDVTDEQAEVKLKNLDRTIQSTQKHAGNLGKTDATPHVDKRARTELSNTEKVLGSAKKRADVLHRTRVNPTISMQDRITSSLKRVESNIGRLTRGSHKIVLEGVDRVTGVARRIISTITSPLALLGAGAGVGAGILYPLKLAGEFEQAQMSLDFYMGSVEEGKRAFQDLIRFAKETPFEFPFLQGATIQLMGAGYNFEQAKRALLAFGDAAGRTGAGMQGIEASLLGFTQIASAGTLNLQDLKQVALNLKLPLNIFARELGVAESELGDIGRAGISSQKAMEAIVRTLEQRFAGSMKELSNSLLGMLAVISDTANLTVWHFGKGMAEPVKRIMFDIIGLTEDTGGAFEEFQKRLERAGERVGLKFEQMYGRLKEFWASISADPAFQKLDFGDKIIYVLNLALDEVSAWLDSEGGKKLQETFTKLGEIGAKAWIAGLKGAFKGAVSSAAHGNLVGAGAMLGLASMLGGGLVLRGAWGLGKGLFGAGKWALGKLRLGSAGTTAAGAAAETAATAGRASIASRILPILGKARPWIRRIGLPVVAGLEAINIARAEDKRTAVISGTGRIAGMIAGGEAGAAAGGAIGGLFGGVGAVPGAVIGGILGSIGGFFGGEMIAEKINAWLDKVDFKALKEKALLMWNDVGQKASDTWKNVTAWASGAWEEARKSASSAWNWIKENFTLESIAEKAGYVVSYLESTIFSGEWWGRQWDEVKNWASEKWASMVEVYESAKATIMSTIFSSEWWQGHWQSVKDWTSEKWDEMKTVWETVKSDISSTLFSKTWWESKWENVKTWASGVLDDITARWESIKESFQAGREAGQAAAAHAAGGIFSSPHLGMVAEAGPEAIIPLSSKMRDRGIELWKQAGRFLGIAPHAEGGIFGGSKLVTEAGPEAGIPFSRSPERIRERGLGLWQQINNVFSPAMPALALAGSGAETGLLYDGIDYGPELSGQVQELNVPISIANITANISGSSLDVEDIAEQVGEQVKQQVKWEITRELANAIENRI